ncbi:MAG: AAA family ATPase [Bacteroidia bacterium]
MQTEKYSLGTQTFDRLIEENRIYVDKTELIYQLLQGSSFVYFLSRPRRFGKSLLISTLKSIFEGKKENFKGLYIYDKIDWQAYPIIHLSMTRIGADNDNLLSALTNALTDRALEDKIELRKESLSQRFEELILALQSKYQQKVVILIDEYDKPITQGLEFDGVELAIKNRDILKTFYGSLKDLDNSIRFLFITGISKFTRVSIFSELNHLTDITLHKRFVNLCGYTQAELEHYFPKGIEKLAQENELTKEECLAKIKAWYDGFSWDGTNFVYNPFSTLRLLESSQFSNYWFESGTPTFLIKRLREVGQISLENLHLDAGIFNTFDLRNLNTLTLLIQTGYLTIKQKLGDDFYSFALTNQEVRNSFNQMLLGEYLQMHGSIAGASIYSIRDAFIVNEVKKVIEIIQTLFEAVPAQLFSKKNANGNYSSVGENFFHAVIYLVFNLLGVKMDAEVSIKNGRIDAVVQTENHVYLFEFKKNNKPKDAIQQMIDNNYAGKYTQSGKMIHLIGVSFSIRKRGLNDWEEKIL